MKYIVKFNNKIFFEPNDNAITFSKYETNDIFSFLSYISSPTFKPNLGEIAIINQKAKLRLKLEDILLEQIYCMRIKNEFMKTYIICNLYKQYFFTIIKVLAKPEKRLYIYHDFLSNRTYQFINIAALVLFTNYFPWYFEDKNGEIVKFNIYQDHPKTYWNFYLGLDDGNAKVKI